MNKRMNNMNRMRRNAKFSPFICLFFLLCLPLSSQAATWSPEVRLTNISGPSWGPRVAAYNGVIHVVWFEYPNFSDPEVYYMRSPDNGNTWNSPQNISNKPNRPDIYPSVAADASGVYVFWSSDTVNGEAFFIRSTDGGTTWKPEQQLTDASGYSRASDILVDGQGVIHVVWYDHREGYSGIYHRQSCDHGATWTPEQWVTQFDGMVDNEDPKIVQAEDHTLYLLFRSTRDGQPQGGWPPFHVYLLRGQSSFCSNGATWLYPAQRVSQGLPDQWSNTYYGTISAGKDGRLHVAYWDENVGNNIIYRRGIPAGAGWAKPEMVSHLPLAHPQMGGDNHPNPGLVEDSMGGVHLFYSEHATVSREYFSMGRLYYRGSSDGGLTWNPVFQLGTSAVTASPQAVHHNGRAHVVWIDYRHDQGVYGSEIYYRNLDLSIIPTPLNDTSEFVRQQYRDFLDREADSGGLQFWVNLIDTGTMTKAEVIESFFWSEEFGLKIAPIVRLYFAYFLRIPDYNGLQYWIDACGSGMSLESVSEFFAASSEFQQRYGSLNNQGFVTLVYQNVLGRLPDAGGLAYWTGLLNSGSLTRGQVMVGFSESLEYRQNSHNEVYVTMMYIGMLRRSPEQGGFDFWVQYMDAGNSGLALINGFLYSPEYENRFQ